MKKKVKGFTAQEIAFGGWKNVRGLRQRLENAAKYTIAELPENIRPKDGRVEICVLLASDARIKTLNHDFRGKDVPTNVLSFPQFSRKEIRGFCAKNEPFNAGDIAIAFQYSRAEARRESKKLVDHATHLVIHGILHLFGYDHVTEAEAVRMEKKEMKIMAALGLSNPYEPAPKVAQGREKA